MTTPDVSVVVISFNDAARLSRAIESVRRQTLRNLEIIVVDDASTDDTEQVVRALASADDRIRYERLAVNSGGCSAPRNRGMSLARAPWVMFCDSDDEYERHACKNLLIAAEQSGAQVVCGLAERVDVATGKAKAWRPEVHERLRVEAGLAAFPELLYDTISVNKIYSRDLLESQALQFPEGLLFEDQLFTLEAMASASVVASIPEVVYRWYVDRLSDEPSITQRRQEARNVADRISVNRRIDAYLSDRGLTDLKAAKDMKFVRHDLYLYLSSILECDDDTALILMGELAPYVSALDPRAFRGARPGIRVAAYHLIIGDVAGVRAGMRWVRWAAVIDCPVREVDGSQVWACEHALDGPTAGGLPASMWLDITDAGLLQIPFSQRRFLHRIEQISVRGRHLSITGSTVDYDGSIADCQRIELVVTAGGRDVATVQGQWLVYEGDRRLWQATGILEHTPGVVLHAGERGAVLVDVWRQGTANRTAVRFEGGELPQVSSSGGTLALKRGANAGIAVTVESVRELRGVNRAKRVTTAAVARALRPVATAGTPVVFAVDSGRAAAGDALAISRSMNEAHPSVPQAWLFRSDPSIVPTWAEGVRIGSARHAWVRQFASALVSDGSLGSVVGGVRIDLGHGVPIHRVGLDAPDAGVVPALAKSARSVHRKADVLLAASRFAEEVERRAFAFGGTIDVVGLPRMDAALNSTHDELKRALDFPLDRPVIVYAPMTESAIDIDAWTAAIGMRAYLVHVNGDSRTEQRAFVRDIDESMVSPAIAASDLFISDYSPHIGDAVLIGRPTILFQPDRLTFLRRTCGLYAGLDVVGPVVEDQSGLHSQVSSWLADGIGWPAPFAEGRRAFRDDRCGPRDGRSGARAVESIMRAAGIA